MRRLGLTVLLAVAACAPARAAQPDMTAVELKFVVCNIEQRQCRTETMPGTMAGAFCMLQAQQIIAQWLGEHPKYFFSGHWRCVPPGTEMGL